MFKIIAIVGAVGLGLLFTPWIPAVGAALWLGQQGDNGQKMLPRGR